MSGTQEEQRRITRLALEAAGEESGFTLAGSGAIREHGLIDRHTEDVDLFTVETRHRQDAFAQFSVISRRGSAPTSTWASTGALTRPRACKSAPF
ncbi:hypothetical protein [Actinomyces glycerinitolerans]|uniref:Uncharacterized protein n=1 Tax=Actinomyces glycerinitolerans TaxID=1892869 RepID=A0A1M4RX19_9ACTO|nr:hypothetical protein [Actinomyces glycerinitolerans]SHE24479.1 Hypothetical protein ACGLYG10_0683 [Actinomyces glycerinitolerans]